MILAAWLRLLLRQGKCGACSAGQGGLHCAAQPNVH